MNWGLIFDESPAARRRLVLLLYAIVGPVFTAAMLLVREPSSPTWLFVAVVGLILAGFAALLVRRNPTTLDWIFPSVVSPTVCCGLAFASSAPHGAAYLGVMGAPLAWSAILFEGPVVVSAFVTAAITSFCVLLALQGFATAAVSTIVFSTINGLVGWVVFGMSKHLRDTRRELAAKSERDRALLEAIPDVLARTDRRGRFIDLHAPPEAKLPVRREELLGRSVFDVISPEVAPGLQTAIDRALASGKVEVFEYGALYGTDERRFEARMARVSGDEVLVIRRDVTELTRTRDALAESEVRFRSLVSGAPIGIFEMDSQGCCTYVNEAWQEFTGLTELQARGHGWLLALPPEDRTGAQAQWTSTVASGAPFRHTTAYQSRQGTRRWMELWVTPRLDARLAVTGFIGGCIDITDRLEAERAVEESRRQLRLVLEGSNDGFWDLDFPSRRFTFSPRCFEMLGEPPQQPLVTGQFWWDRVHPDDVALVKSALAAHQEGGADRLDFEFRLRHASGAWRWVQARGKAVERGPEGRALRLAGTLRDLTALREVQDQLRDALARDQKLVVELREALSNVKTLTGLIPLCMHCHRIRDDSGYWARLEAYLSAHSDAKFTHGLCPECFAANYPPSGTV